jgi:hypothetical protein
VRDCREAKASVHAPVALGAFAFLCTPKLLHLLLSALPEHLRRDEEYGQVTLFLGLPLVLLVLLRVRVVADKLLPSLYEIFTPAGMEGFFLEVGMPAQEGGTAPPLGPEEIERTLAAAPKYGMEFPLPLGE